MNDSLSLIEMVMLTQRSSMEVIIQAVSTWRRHDSSFSIAVTISDRNSSPILQNLSRVLEIVKRPCIYSVVLLRYKMSIFRCISSIVDSSRSSLSTSMRRNFSVGVIGANRSSSILRNNTCNCLILNVIMCFMWNGQVKIC